MPVATGNERSGGGANPCARTKTKKLPNGSFFVFSAIRERTLEEGFDHKRKADVSMPVATGNECSGGEANPCARTNIKRES